MASVGTNIIDLAPGERWSKNKRTSWIAFTYQVDVLQNGVDRDIGQIVTDNRSWMSIVVFQQVSSEFIRPRISPLKRAAALFKHNNTINLLKYCLLRIMIYSVCW